MTERSAEVVSEALRGSLTSVSEGCIECGLCLYECFFLKRHGTPKAVADSYDPTLDTCQGMAFECSLCRLCAAVCPAAVDPAAMFLEMRREAVIRGNGHYPGHRRILDYERRGTSKRYTWYSFPAGCDTAFFPGCTLSGTRPEAVTKTYKTLRAHIPSLGLVLDCCANPSHDLGRRHDFHSMFGEMRDFLVGNGVKSVLVACPNCHKVFRNHSRDLSVKTVYEVMAEERLADATTAAGTVTIHDPCAVRFEPEVHRAVRSLVAAKGLEVKEMPHSGEQTVCCGEGGAVGFVAPALAGRWKSLRRSEAGDRRIITYCAGCVSMLGPGASHVLDLVFEPVATMAGKMKPSRPPLTYWNRLRLKRASRRRADAAVERERAS